MSSELAKLKSAAEKVGGKVERVDVKVGGETIPFFFKRIGYLKAREIVAIPMEFSPMLDDEHPAQVTVNPSKVPERNVRLIAESLVDEEGNPYATVAEIGALPAELGDALFAAAEKVNAIGKEALANAEKNSAATASGSSSSS